MTDGTDPGFQLTETNHGIIIDDARDIALPDDCVDLVITSPPYPMIEMWDDAFSEMNNTIGDALDAGDSDTAFELMHTELDQVWAALVDAVCDGGLICINIGDATRSIGGSFQSFPNAARITEAFRELGVDVLPRFHWQKPTNSPTSFMGSGTIPPNAYAKAEHEYLLVFRNGTRQSYPTKDPRRYESAYFYEERNQWFSDYWDTVGTANQALPAETDGGTVVEESRDRAAAFPVEIPYRVVNMFSLYGDTVLDPFLGTGTTTLAALMAGRNSIGVEQDAAVAETIHEHLPNGVIEACMNRIADRVQNHIDYVTTRIQNGSDPSYSADQMPFPVVTEAEKDILFYVIENVTTDTEVTKIPDAAYEYTITASYTEYNNTIPSTLAQYS